MLDYFTKEVSCLPAATPVWLHACMQPQRRACTPTLIQGCIRSCRCMHPCMSVGANAMRQHTCAHLHTGARTLRRAGHHFPVRRLDAGAAGAAVLHCAREVFSQGLLYSQVSAPILSRADCISCVTPRVRAFYRFVRECACFWWVSCCTELFEYLPPSNRQGEMTSFFCLLRKGICVAMK